jgi:hypothetical protein
LHNRRDLRLTNFVTGDHRWLARTLPDLLRPGERTLELGAGTGELAARLHHAGISVDALDLWPAPENWPSERAWHRADLCAFDGYRAYDAIIGNLIFHQFDASTLTALGAAIRQNARVIVACEPLRRRFSQVLFRTFAALVGANHVSLHDAHVSIAAGFRHAELPHALGLDPREWRLTCTQTLLGTCRMIAVRRA